MKKIIILLLATHISYVGTTQENNLRLIERYILEYSGSSELGNDYGISKLKERDKNECFNLVVDYVSTLEAAKQIRNGIGLVGKLSDEKDTLLNIKQTLWLLDYMFHDDGDVRSSAIGSFERRPHYAYNKEVKDKYVRLLIQYKGERSLNFHLISNLKLYAAIPFLQGLLDKSSLDVDIFQSDYWLISKTLYKLGDPKARSFCKKTLDSLYESPKFREKESIKSQWYFIGNADAFDFFKKELLANENNHTIIGSYGRCGDRAHKISDDAIRNLASIVENIPTEYGNRLDEAKLQLLKKWLLSQSKEKLVFQNEISIYGTARQ